MQNVMPICESNNHSQVIHFTNIYSQSNPSTTQSNQVIHFTNIYSQSNPSTTQSKSVTCPQGQNSHFSHYKGNFVILPNIRVFHVHKKLSIFSSV
ncbi:hypothetical protein V6Z11_A07G195000 [Gossypium hirsutum]